LYSYLGYFYIFLFGVFYCGFLFALFFGVTMWFLYVNNIEVTIVFELMYIFKNVVYNSCSLWKRPLILCNLLLRWLIHALRYLTITSTIGSSFVITFSPYFNVGSYIQIINFWMTFKNKCKKGYWGLFWKLGQQLLKEKLIHFQSICVLHLHILSIVSCKDKNFEELWCTPKLLKRFKCKFEGENN